MAWFPFPFSRDSSKAKLGLLSTIVCSTAFTVCFYFCLTFFFFKQYCSQTGSFMKFRIIFRVHVLGLSSASSARLDVWPLARFVTCWNSISPPSWESWRGQSDMPPWAECQLLKSPFISRIMNIDPWWLSGKESSCQCRRHEFDPWSRKIPHNHRAIKPESRNYWSPGTLEPVLHSKRVAPACRN